jgi:hypothetical protein
MIGMKTRNLQGVPLLLIVLSYILYAGTRCSVVLKRYATRRKVAGSRPVEVNAFFFFFFFQFI